MEVIEVTPNEYDNIIVKPHYCFNTGAFNSLNSNKCDEVYYLVFKDSKIRLGIILGRREKIAYSPFSAPFGGFEYLSKDIKLSQIDAAIESLNAWAISKKLQAIKIVLPPVFYNPNFLTKVTNCLYRAGYENSSLDINYQFQTNNFGKDYISTIWYNARKNLRRAIKSELTFEKLAQKEGEIAYSIISENRKQRGFPLRMQWAQVLETTTIIPADFFIVKKEAIIIAAAIVFHIAKDVVQVIYWGDLPAYSNFKTMNFLSYQIFKHYKEDGIKVIDIGPSTEDSVPNHGLCEFKESIGCNLSLKSGFYKNMDTCIS